MASEQVRIYGRGYGKLWPSLLENPKIDWKARLCFGVMGSFGILAVAGLKAIARRMGVKSLATVRAAQAVLVTEGWLFLIAEGSAKFPRAWWLADRPFEWLHDAEATAELQEAIKLEKDRREKKSKKEGLHVVGSQETGAPMACNPNQEKTLSSNQENTVAAPAAVAPLETTQQQALDQAKTQARAARGKILAAFARWWLTQPQHVGLVYPHGPGDKAAADALVEAGLALDQMPALLAAWPAVADDYTRANAFAFRVFRSSFLKIQAEAARARPAAACAHPKEAYEVSRTFGDGVQTGTCKACGKPVARYTDGRVEG